MSDAGGGQLLAGRPVEAEEAALALRDVSMVYRTRKAETTALLDITLNVRAGEFLSLVGRSGCGKSTLLRIVSGLVRPTAGTVECHGKEVTGPLDDFGMVFQSPVLLPWRTALDNVLLPIEMLRRDKNQYRDRAMDLLRLVGLEEFAKARPHELSGGMRQRVAICRSLIHDPSFLLMDEPFSAVDEITREELNNVLLDVWAASGKTILFVTHSIQEAIALSDRVAVFTARPGRLREVYSVDVPRPRALDSQYHVELAHLARNIRTAIGIEEVT